MWLGNISVFITMGELASMIPTAGGQYHWVNVLAPESSKKFLNYVTGKLTLFTRQGMMSLLTGSLGWVTVAGWVAGLTASAFFVSSLIEGLIVQNMPKYIPERWQGTLLFYAVLLFCISINTILSKTLPAIEVLVLILHLLGFFAILIPLVYLAPHGNTHTIFTSFSNEGGWSTQALSFFTGLNGNAIALLGGYTIQI